MLTDSRLSKRNECHFVPKECLREINFLTLVGQNGVNVHPSAKLIEQGRVKKFIYIYLFVSLAYKFVYIFRKCKYTTICGTKRIKQEEYCYKKDSKCERLFKEGKLFRSKETKTESIYFETVNGKEEVLKKTKAALALAQRAITSNSALSAL